MKKKLLSLILALALLTGLLPAGLISAQAAEADLMAHPVTGGSIYFDPITGAVTDCDLSVTKANIPSSINGVAVTAIGDYAFKSCYDLTDITIPDSVTTIGNSAFYKCSLLTNITLPDSVISIKHNAFSYCNNLTDITIPDGVTSIELATFMSCTSLTNITIPDSVTSIGSFAFDGCSNLTTITLPDGVTTIEEYAFSDCNSLTNITLPNSMTSIGDKAFHSCHKLTSVTIPSGVVSIGPEAFHGCSDELCLRIVRNSYAHRYAETNNIKYTIHDHSYTSAIITSPTCTEPGYTTYTCSCGESYVDDEIPALGHDSTAVVTEATCLNGGYTTYSCTRCGDSYVGDEKSALGHDFQDNLCTVCGAKDPDYVAPVDPDQPGDGGGKEEDLLRNFTDVPAATNWAYAGIAYCVERGLMNGTSNTTFNPNGTVSRAQLVTILYRAAGSPKTEYKGTFTDVPKGTWYSLAVEWAAANGVVNGIGKGKFGPDQSITREQIATILYRYENEPAVSGNLDGFPDKGSVSGFAVKGLIWATQEGLINGVSSNGVTTLAPQNNATRAQIAAIIMRYLVN